MRVLFIGDIFGKPGRELLTTHLPALLSQYRADFCVANGENLADGKGLTEKTVKPLLDAGVDLITGGNHLWDRPESLDFIAAGNHIVRPLNYPSAAPGKTFLTVWKDDLNLSVLNLLGQVYMPACDSPFTALEHILPEVKSFSPNVLIDFHAESTAEKRAFGYYADGTVTAVIGTHTHIQTADEEILPNGTAYITDAGMTGSHHSVIGIKKDIILRKFVTGIPQRYEVSSLGLQINGVCIEIDHQTGKSVSIERIRILFEDQASG